MDFENITSEYKRGKYAEFSVIIRCKDGYINLTKLCLLKGKRFSHWTDNKNSKQILLKFPPLDFSHRGVDNEIRGTYGPPELVPIIAMWISPEFAVAMSKFVNHYLLIRAQDKILAKLEEESQGANEPLVQKLQRILSKRDWFSDTSTLQTRDSTIGCIYFIRAREYVKIGYTYNSVKERLENLQIGCPDTLKLIRAYNSTYCEEKEKELHEQFSSKRVRGEWFLLTDVEVFDIVV